MRISTWQTEESQSTMNYGKKVLECSCRRHEEATEMAMACVCLSVCLSTFMLMTRQWGRTIRLPLILALLLLLRRVVVTSDRWRVQQRCEAVLHQLLACPPHHWHTSISAAAAVTLSPAAYSWAVLTVFLFFCLRHHHRLTTTTTTTTTTRCLCCLQPRSVCHSPPSHHQSHCLHRRNP